MKVMEPFDVAFMKDTPIEVRWKYYSMLRAIGPDKRFSQGMRLAQMTRETWLANIQKQNPDFSKEDVRREYLRRILTPEQFEIHYPKEKASGI